MFINLSLSHSKALFALLLCLAITACNNQPNPNNTAEAPAENQAATQASATKTEVLISDAWARETAPGQSVGAAYMTLTSPTDVTLVYVESSVAESAEIHSMSMENNVMKMRMLEELPLKGGKPEKLAPGGFHLMLFDLKAPLKAGETVTLTLCFKDEKGEITHQDVSLPVKADN
jgi:copper(I)-binding protein